MTLSVKCIATSAMRLPPHDGQNPRPLHENGRSKSLAHEGQWMRQKPRVGSPQATKARSSRST